MRRGLMGWSIVVATIAMPACGDDDGVTLDGGAALDAGASDAGVDAGTTGDAGLDAGASDAGASDTGASDAGASDAGASDAGSADAGTDAGPVDAGVDAGATDAGPRVYDVRVRADAACSELRFEPASISVPAGTSFTVRWINATGCTDIDVDMGGTVPIVLGLEPGNSYHDTIRMWCGSYTGNYTFRAYYAPEYPAYLPVDCSG